MTTKQQDQSKVLEQMIKDYKEKKDVYLKIPALADSFEQLIVIYGDIAICLQKQVKDITGVTRTKAGVKDVLASSAYTVAAGVYAWASTTKNDMVLNQVNFTELALQSLTDKLISPTCKNIYDLAVANQAELVPFGVDADSIQQLQNDLDAYNTWSAEPRKQTLNRRAETQKLKLLFSEAFKLIKESTDKLIVKMKKIDMDTYNSYKAARAMPHAAKAKTDVPPPPKQS